MSEMTMDMKMSTAEIISCCRYGKVESVTAEQLLQVVKFYENAETSCNESQYDVGWEDGYFSAIDEMKGKQETL